MKTQEWTFRDKSEWGNGEWQREPDKVQWMDNETGFPCLIVRNNGGALCGYVGLAEGHPFYGIGYGECRHRTPDESYCDHSPGSAVDVHGGLTFADFCVEDGKEHGICHIPGAGEPDKVWWLGFDCAHSGDLVPAYEKNLRDWGSWYKDIEYVKSQCRLLASQLKETR